MGKDGPSLLKPHQKTDGIFLLPDFQVDSLNES